MSPRRAARGSIRTTSRSIVVVGVVEVAVGGARRGRAARAPWRSPPPRRRHRAGDRCIDLVAVTATCSASLAERGPDRRRLGDVAERRRRGVRVDVHDVAPAVSAGVAQGQRHRAGRAGAGRVGLRRRGGRRRRARHRRPRRRPGHRGRAACSADSRTRTPAPSPRRSRRGPCRTAGRRAVGLVLPRGQRRIAAKPAMRQRVDAGLGPPDDDHVGPARCGSGRAPYATASAPDAHADTGVCTPASAPSSRPTSAAGPFGISIGMVCGDTRRAPFSRSTSSLAEQRERTADAGGDDDARAARGRPPVRRRRPTPRARR